MVNLLSPWHVEEVRDRLRELAPSLDHDLLWQKWRQERETGSDLVFRQRLLRMVRQLTERCERCILSRNRTRVVVTDGNVYARVLLVGEGPGYSEDLAGYPFICKRTLMASPCGSCSRLGLCHGHQILHGGRYMGSKPSRKPRCQQDKDGSDVSIDHMRTAGQVLSNILEQLGVSRTSWGDRESPIAITNAVRCHSVGSDGITNRPPGDLQVMKCFSWLQLEALLIQPRVTVALGDVAFKALLGTDSGVNVYGHRWFTRKPPFGVVLKTYHPAYLVRRGQAEGGDAYDNVYRTLKIAIWCACQERDPNPWENPYVLDQKSDAADAMMDEEEDDDDML